MTSLLIVMAVAFGAPFLLGLFPRVRLPAVVLEIVAGIVVGPSVLGWVTVDQTIAVISTLGLAFLLFLAGLEIDFARLRGQTLRLTAAAFGLSFVIALAVSGALNLAGLVDAPLLVAIALVATSLGVLIPVLKDAGESTSTLGQLVIAAGSIADFGAIILLSIFFTGEGGTGATLLLIGSLLATAAAVLVAVRGAERSMRIRDDLLRLQDTTAQIRVRGAMVLLVAFAAIAETLGLEAILGTFMAGAILALLDGDQAMTHPQFRLKARGDRVRVLHPGVLRDHRRAVRARRAGREPLVGPAVPGRTAGGARAAGAALPRPAGRPRCGCGRAAAGDLAAVHRHRLRHRGPAGRHRRGHE